MINDTTYERYKLTKMIVYTNVEHNAQRLYSNHNYYNTCGIISRKIGYANYHIIVNIVIISFIGSESPKIAR